MVKNTYQFNIYNGLTYLIYILYAVSLLNIYQTPRQYIKIINMFLRIIIGLILVISFNPLRPIEFIKEHRDIAFTAGSYILLDIATELYYRFELQDKFSLYNLNGKENN